MELEGENDILLTKLKVSLEKSTNTLHKKALIFVRSLHENFGSKKLTGIEGLKLYTKSIIDLLIAFQKNNDFSDEEILNYEALIFTLAVCLKQLPQEILRGQALFEKIEKIVKFSLSFEDLSNNCVILKYFMKIDYSTDLLNENSHQNELIEQNDLSSTDNSSNVTLSKKTSRNDDSDVLYDELTKTVYHRKDDPIAFKKAKKRIQNRESALRMKKLKQENILKTEDQINNLKQENNRLHNENAILKKEKMFLIEQIKYMQNLLKESNIKLTTTADTKEQELVNDTGYNYSSFGQKIKGKLFNVFIICTLSIIYIAGECSSLGDGTTQQINFSTEKIIKLNTVTETKKNTFYLWSIISKIILIAIVILIIPWIKTLTSVVRRNNIKKYI